VRGSRGKGPEGFRSALEGVLGWPLWGVLTVTGSKTWSSKGFGDNWGNFCRAGIRSRTGPSANAQSKLNPRKISEGLVCWIKVWGLWEPRI
jgi:hypothetical protein